MGEYIREFETVSAYTTSRENDYIEPGVSGTEENDETNYNEPGMSTPLTFQILSDGTIAYNKYGSISRTLEYKKNNDNGVEIVSGSSTSISVNSGDIVEFRGTNNNLASAYNVYTYFSTTCQFNLCGNIMSLLGKTNFYSFVTLTPSNDCGFTCLFQNCANLINAEDLLLPATTIQAGCANLYYRLFAGCTSLVKGPKLLPATNVAGYGSYKEMFAGCNNLITSPEIVTPTFPSNCCRAMFNGCTKLNYIVCLTVTKTAAECTDYGVQGVQTDSGTFVKSANASGGTGIHGIPNGGTVINA